MTHIIYQENQYMEPAPAGDTPSFLEGTMHHMDGGCTRFFQTQPHAIRSLLEHLSPERVFHQPQLYIADADSLSLFSTRSIAWIEVRMDSVPAWTFRHGADCISAITEEEFHVLAARPVPYVDGKARYMVVQIDMVNGDRLYQRIDGLKFTLLPDMTMALKDLFHDYNCLFARKSEGGAMLVNVANVERMRYYPRSPLLSAAVPPGTWLAQKVQVHCSKESGAFCTDAVGLSMERPC